MLRRIVVLSLGVVIPFKGQMTLSQGSLRFLEFITIVKSVMKWNSNENGVMVGVTV